MQGHYLQSLIACVFLFIYLTLAMIHFVESVGNNLSAQSLPNSHVLESSSFLSTLKYKQTQLLNNFKDHTHIQLYIRNVKTTSIIDSAHELEGEDTVPVCKQDNEKIILTPNGKSLDEMDERFYVNIKTKQEIMNNSSTLRMILSLISNELVDPRNNLFTSDEAIRTYNSFDGSSSDILQIDRFPHQPSHAAYIHSMMHTDCKPWSRCRNYFMSIGKIMGVAILNKQFLDLSFTSLFYKYILGKAIGLNDIEQVDATLFNHLQQIKDDSQYLSTNKFTMTYKHYSKSGVKVIDLIINGSNTIVTDLNKNTYIDGTIESFVTKQIAPAMRAVRMGLFEIIPKNNFKPFNELELKVLISGNANIDICDFQKYLSVWPFGFGKNYYRAQLQWFWRMVNEFDRDMVSRLLLYVTGMSRLPIDGFNVQTSEFPHRMWFNLCFEPLIFPVYTWIDSFPLYAEMILPQFSTFDEMKNRFEEILNKRGGVSVWYFPVCKQLQYKNCVGFSFDSMISLIS